MNYLRLDIFLEKPGQNIDLLVDILAVSDPDRVVKRERVQIYNTGIKTWLNLWFKYRLVGLGEVLVEQLWFSFTGFKDDSKIVPSLILWSFLELDCLTWPTPPQLWETKITTYPNRALNWNCGMVWLLSSVRANNNHEKFVKGDVIPEQGNMVLAGK